MIKFNNVYIDNIYINMYEQSIYEGYTIWYIIVYWNYIIN